MKDLLKTLTFALIFMLVGAIVSYFPIKGHFQAHSEHFSPKVEQVIVHDTIMRVNQNFVEKRILVHDTIKIALVDTLIRKDTIYLPREQKVYRDSSYRAVVSGISPRLDTIEVFSKTITKIATQKEWRKWDYGIQAGIGLVCPFNTTPTFGGYVGVGVTYHF